MHCIRLNIFIFLCPLSVTLHYFCVFQVLQERFTKFASETNSIGQQRMEQVNKMVNEMIDCGHSDAATIAEWKDGLNESWADLLELMETRRQMLAASHQLHKFFTDCKEVQYKTNIKLLFRCAAFFISKVDSLAMTCSFYF